MTNDKENKMDRREFAGAAVAGIGGLSLSSLAEASEEIISNEQLADILSKTNNAISIIYRPGSNFPHMNCGMSFVNNGTRKADGSVLIQEDSSDSTSSGDGYSVRSQGVYSTKIDFSHPSIAAVAINDIHKSEGQYVRSGNGWVFNAGGTVVVIYENGCINKIDGAAR